MKTNVLKKFQLDDLSEDELATIKVAVDKKINNIQVNKKKRLLDSEEVLHLKDRIKQFKSDLDKFAKNDVSVEVAVPIKFTVDKSLDFYEDDIFNIDFYDMFPMKYDIVLGNIKSNKFTKKQVKFLSNIIYYLYQSCIDNGFSVDEMPFFPSSINSDYQKLAEEFHSIQDELEKFDINLLSELDNS